MIQCIEKDWTMIFGHLKHLRRFVKLLSRNPWHYNLMIREFSYHHELRSAFDILDMMKELGVAPDLFTYRALMDACGRCNEPSRAAAVFEVCPSCTFLRWHWSPWRGLTCVFEALYAIYLIRVATNITSWPLRCPCSYFSRPHAFLLLMCSFFTTLECAGYAEGWA